MHNSIPNLLLKLLWPYIFLINGLYAGNGVQEVTIKQILGAGAGHVVKQKDQSSSIRSSRTTRGARDTITFCS